MRDVRRHLLEVAERLFYAHGYRAVGVDRLIAEADVAKATFYRHFPTKDDLVVAVLDARDSRWRQELAEQLVARAPDPRDRPLAVFDVLAEQFASDGFRGCAFLNTMVEVASRSHPAHAAAQRTSSTSPTISRGCCARPLCRAPLSWRPSSCCSSTARS
jgi:AcrR family transcriptional regulator